MSNDSKLLKEIRTRLMRFINRRERLLREERSRGLAVPDINRKSKAIAVLKAQLQASCRWNLRSHILWISALRDEIRLLLPEKWEYRQAIVWVLNFCLQQELQLKK